MIEMKAAKTELTVNEWKKKWWKAFEETLKKNDEVMKILAKL